MRARNVAASNLHSSSAAFFSHQIPAALIWSATLSGRACDAPHPGSEISKSDVGEQKHGGEKSRNSRLKRFFCGLFINARIILPDFSVICIDDDLIWQVELWITIEYCNKRQLPGKCVETRCFTCYGNNSWGQTDVGDLKLPRFVQNAKRKGMLKKKKKKFYLCGLHILQDWTVGCNFYLSPPFHWWPKVSGHWE